MPRKSINIILSLVFLCSTAFAGIKQVDQQGDLYYYWLANNKQIKYIKSIDQGTTFSAPKLIHETTREISAFDIKQAGADYYLVYTLKEPKYTYLKTNTTKPKLVLTPDHYLQTQPVSLSKDTNKNLNKLVYTGLSSLEPQVLFETHDEISSFGIDNLGNNLIVFCQNQYLDRKETRFWVSLDNGHTFSQSRQIDIKQNLLGFILADQTLIALAEEKDNVSVKKIESPPPPPPTITAPNNNSYYSKTNFKVIINKPAQEQTINMIEISNNADFPINSTWLFEQQTNEFNPSVEFDDGQYYVRAYVFNGVNNSTKSEPVFFHIDNTPPKVSSLEAEQGKSSIYFKGNISELPVSLSINNNAAAVDQNAQFSADYQLEQGNNIFSFSLVDAAGNTAYSTYEVYYNSASPEIIMVQPDANQWFKTDSNIIIEAAVADQQDDLDENCGIELYLNNKKIEHNLSYDQEEKNIFGFISLPENMPEGTQKAKLALNDKAGNCGTRTFNINIDNSPPQIKYSSLQPCFSNSLAQVSLEVFDAGAGVDLNSTHITISGIELKGSATTESGCIVIQPKLLMSGGSYEVEISTRDLIGNVSATKVFSLIIDTVPPILVLEQTQEANNPTLLIKGSVSDQYPNKVKIHNNSNLIKEIPLSDNNFQYNLPLCLGTNNIKVEAYDQAGNMSSKSLSVISDSAASNSIITSCQNGPNPFSPQKDDNIYFVYTLSQAADLKLYVFDLAGNLIWSKNISNASSGTISWNGMDSYGRALNNGVYPYILCATVGQDKEIRRGKILVYRY